MKKTDIALAIALLLLVSGCKQGTGKNDLPRVAIAGIAIESSTFSPAVTHEEAFRARVGDDVFSYYPFFSPDSGIIDRAVWLPLCGACHARQDRHP